MAVSLFATKIVKATLSCLLGFAVAPGMALGGISTAPGKTALEDTRARQLKLEEHREPAWQIIEPHLPNLETGTPEALETAADVLRARRFPEDAVEYYVAALRRGGNEERLLNKVAVTELSLRQIAMARAYLKLLVNKHKKNAEGWNNLGATEYMDGRMTPALSAYRKAIKLNPKSAVFHINLGSALVERKEYEEARGEFSKALDLDPEMGKDREDIVGMSAHVLSASDRAEFSFEMARVYASRKQIDQMLVELAKALENGMDVQAKMAEDPVLGKYVTDARLVLLIQNAKAQNKPDLAKISGPLWPLPAATN